MAAQVTLGGAHYFVEGDIAKIDADYYFVRKDDTGEQIRLVVNADTNLDCAAMPESRTREERKSGSQSETMTSERIAPKEASSSGERATTAARATQGRDSPRSWVSHRPVRISDGRSCESGSR